MSCVHTSTMSTDLPNGDVPMLKAGMPRPSDAPPLPASGQDGPTHEVPVAAGLVPNAPRTLAPAPAPPPACLNEVPKLALGIIMASLTNMAP